MGAVQDLSPAKKHNAYAAANQIRSGKVKAFPRGEFTAGTARRRDGQVLVEVQRVPPSSR